MKQGKHYNPRKPLDVLSKSALAYLGTIDAQANRAPRSLGDNFPHYALGYTKTSYDSALTRFERLIALRARLPATVTPASRARYDALAMAIWKRLDATSRAMSAASFNVTHPIITTD